MPVRRTTSDSEGIDSPIGEGVFTDRTVSYSAGAGRRAARPGAGNPPLQHQPDHPAFPGVDHEVDFDNVRLDAEPVAVSEPATLALSGVALAGLALLARRRRPH